MLDEPCFLMKETIRLIQERGIQESSFITHLPYLWLKRLVAGNFKNPSVNRIVQAYEKLTGTKLI